MAEFSIPSDSYGKIDADFVDIGLQHEQNFASQDPIENGGSFDIWKDQFAIDNIDSVRFDTTPFSLNSKTQVNSANSILPIIDFSPTLAPENLSDVLEEAENTQLITAGVDGMPKSDNPPKNQNENAIVKVIFLVMSIAVEFILPKNKP